MTKAEFFELVMEYGWEYRIGSMELCRGRFYFQMWRPPGQVILKSYDGETDISFNPAFLLQGTRKPWIIGPFSNGWFSLKANRFVR